MREKEEEGLLAWIGNNAVFILFFCLLAVLFMSLFSDNYLDSQLAECREESVTFPFVMTIEGKECHHREYHINSKRELLSIRCLEQPTPQPSEDDLDCCEDYNECMQGLENMINLYIDDVLVPDLQQLPEPEKEPPCRKWVCEEVGNSIYCKTKTQYEEPCHLGGQNK